MNSAAPNHTTGRRPIPVASNRMNAAAIERSQSLSSDSSASSQVTMLSLARPPSSNASNPNPAAATAASALSRAQLPPRTSSREVSFRQTSPAISPQTSNSPTMSHPPDYHRHRARQHSQGFFEPSLRSTSLQSSGSISTSLTASAIAAQAAMHNQNPQHARRRSQTIQEQLSMTQQVTGKRKPSYAVQTQTPLLSNAPANITNSQPGLRIGNRSQAASAAVSAYPVSPVLSPSEQSRSASPSVEQKPEKEKSRMKIFSKGKTLHISKDRDGHRMMGALSPTKMGVYSTSTQPRILNQSTTSLVDGVLSSGSSLYSSTNASSSTLVLPEKEKHRHNFLSRQKHKLGNSDHYNLPLSSASSNSRPADPNAPQSLYSFAPPSPGPSATLNKSISGLDLRHGGRALREKKREGGAAGDGVFRDRDNFGSDFPSASTHVVPGVFGPPPTAGAMTPDLQGLGSFGVLNIAPDDAWPFLKARLLGIFEGDGEVPRTPVEDFNRLVSVHLQLCIQRRAPSVILEDLREILQIGFSSLDQTLRRIPDDRLVPHMVDIWLTVFGTILPFLQAVFLPLDLEFKGRGAIMSPREAADFWGALPVFTKSNAIRTPKSASSFPTSVPPPKPPVIQVSLGEALDVRTLVLLAFRDSVILPRHDILLTIFSRLSLDSINGYAIPSDRLTSPSMRPGTAASSGSGGNSDLHSASYNSQSSHLLDSSTLGSLGARSRATSNTSAGSFQSVSAQRPQPNSHPSSRAHGGQAQPIDSAKVTQTAARMLQCVSVLAGLQTPESGVWSGTASGSTGHTTAPIAEESNGEEEDAELEARRKMEKLAKELKLNWLGRGRTGRQRRGFVGSKVRPPIGLGIGVGA